MNQRINELFETATAWTLGPPLLFFDRLRDRVTHSSDRIEDETQRRVSKARDEASELRRDWLPEQDSRPYENRTFAELNELAEERGGIEGRSNPALRPRDRGIPSRDETGLLTPVRRHGPKRRRERHALCRQFLSGP